MRIIGRCYKCGKITIFTRRRKILCHKCQEQAKIKTNGKYPKESIDGDTTFSTRMQRRRIIKKQGRCQLCGSTENLTAHHIGGSTELGLTCLCSTCHRAYEHWQQTRRSIKS